MAEVTKIQWTDHTFDPWIGCTKVSPGCAHCYAEKEQFVRVQRSRGKELWGPKAQRHITSDQYWRQPLRWNAAAEKEGRRHRVFCASLADIFEDRPELEEPRVRLFRLICATPQLDWQLLTKRPEVAKQVLGCDDDWFIDQLVIALRRVRRRVDPLDRTRNSFIRAVLCDNWPLANLWMMVSVENQEYAESRIPKLLEVPARIHGLSIEPLLGPVDLSSWFRKARPDRICGIDWAVIGGESGPHARPCHLKWICDLVRQCREARVKCFVKQLGAVVATDRQDEERFNHPNVNPRLQEAMRIARAGYVYECRDPKGGDIEEFPDELKVREFPGV